MENKIEIWKEFPNAQGYYISNLGNVFIKKSKKFPNGRLMIKGDFTIDKDGYARINFKRNDGIYTFSPVHRIVALSFLPKKEGKNIVNHKDSDRLNNCVDNLEWVTNQENRNHAIKNGLHFCGEKCSWSKLTEKDVLFIRKDTFYNITQLAKMFKVSRATIRDIKKGRSWKQLKRYAELSQNEVIEVENKKSLR